MWAINPPSSISNIPQCAVPVRLAPSPPCITLRRSAVLCRTLLLTLARTSPTQLSQYVWIDKSHPSTEVHRRVIAKSIARVRRMGPFSVETRSSDADESCNLQLLTNPPSSATPKTGLLRRSLHLPTHRRPPSLPVAAQPAHDRFARLVRRADAAAGGAEPGFWGKLRDAAVGSVVAGARVGQ